LFTTFRGDLYFH